MALLVEIPNGCVSGVATEASLIPVLLTWVQLDSISDLFFVSVFEVDIIFRVRFVLLSQGKGESKFV